MATRLHLFILLGVLELGHAQEQSCENTRVVFQDVQNVNVPGGASSNVILPYFTAIGTAIGTFIVAALVKLVKTGIHSVDIHALE